MQGEMGAGGEVPSTPFMRLSVRKTSKSQDGMSSYPALTGVVHVGAPVGGAVGAGVNAHHSRLQFRLRLGAQLQVLSHNAHSAVERTHRADSKRTQYSSKNA